MAMNLEFLDSLREAVFMTRVLVRKSCMVAVADARELGVPNVRAGMIKKLFFFIWGYKIRKPLKKFCHVEVFSQCRGARTMSASML